MNGPRRHWVSMSLRPKPTASHCRLPSPALPAFVAAFQSYQVVFTGYDPFSSINIVALAVLGGIGFARARSPG